MKFINIRELSTGTSLFIVQGPIAALFRADRVAARQNRPAIPPRCALSARKIPRNRPPSDK